MDVLNEGSVAVKWTQPCALPACVSRLENSAGRDYNRRVCEQETAAGGWTVSPAAPLPALAAALTLLSA